MGYVLVLQPTPTGGYGCEVFIVEGERILSVIALLRDDTPPAPAGVMYRCTGSSLRVRNGPAATYAVVGYLAYNENVKITIERYGWGYFESAAVKGWASLAYLARV